MGVAPKKKTTVSSKANRIWRARNGPATPAAASGERVMRALTLGYMTMLSGTMSAMTIRAMRSAPANKPTAVAPEAKVRNSGAAVE